MRKLLNGAILTILAFVAVLPAAPQALAEATACRGALGAVTVDDLEVPNGATCTLTDTRVRGNIDIEPGATLRASGASVRGNIQSDGHALVDIASSITRGSIQLRDGGAFSIVNTNVVGDIQVVDNNGASSLDDNTVGDDVHVKGHRGGVAITENEVEGNLQCRRNDPAPTGGGNTVLGNKEGQCRRL